MINQIIEFIRSLIWKNSNVDNKKEYIHNLVVHDALKRDLNPKNIYIADKKYVSHSLSKMKYILALDDTNKRKYFDEVFDCDDFAAMLYGRMKEKHGNATFGEVWAYWKENGEIFGHALNVYYCYQYDITYLIEPQTDKIFIKPKHWEVLFVKM